MSAIEVGNVSCGKGQKKFGELFVFEDAISRVGIPVGIINGQHGGPVVTVVAGTHACEYAGIDTAVKLYHDTVPGELTGTLIIMPVINPAAFKTVTPYVNPIDGLNMAFMFTGRTDQTTTERMCSRILEDAVFKSNYVLDLHGGDIGEIMLPSVIAGVYGIPDLDNRTMDMARAFGTEYIIQHKPGEGPSTAAKYSYDSTLEAQSSLRGIPGIVGEIGSNGQSNREDVEYYLTCVQNVLGYLGMIQREPDVPDSQKLIGGSLRSRASCGGVFTPSVSVGQNIRKGTQLGTIVDLKGDERERLLSPVDGLVTLLFTKHVVDSGQMLMTISTEVRELPARARSGLVNG
jgi:predicted deacylase